METARTNLMQQFTLTEIQSNAILDMQLRRLTLLERNKIEEELAEVLQNIAYLEDLLANPVKIDFLIKEESADLKKKYGNSRRSVINAEEATELTAEDLVPHQEVVVTLSQRGYIKRVPSETYRRQHRGGLGIQAMTMREKDAPYRLLVADTHDDLLVFTDKGKVYRLRCWDVPEGTRQSRGVPLVHLVSLMQDEQVTEIVRVENFENSDFMVMATRLGEVKKTPPQSVHTGAQQRPSGHEPGTRRCAHRGEAGGGGWRGHHGDRGSTVGAVCGEATAGGLPTERRRPGASASIRATRWWRWT